MTKHFLHAAVLLSALLALPAWAWAYIDPGTGSMVLQLVIAGILGALYTIKLYWRRISAVLAKLLGRKSSEQDKDV